jgi:ABC-2 type transport system ATP-binding protein
MPAATAASPAADSAAPRTSAATAASRPLTQRTTVLDGIDLAVPEGTIFAMLGPNG